jgi:Nuclear transport factor 2 (NTF2) domain
MAASSTELLAVVERSPPAIAVHDRTAWVGLFTDDGRVEDPFGSRPHIGHDQIGRFYDTFIGPRQIIFHRDFDAVADAAVVRDLMLEIVMAPGVTLNVPMHLRYDLRPSGDDWAVDRLRAHWELPTMVVQMLRQGAKSLPVSLRMGAGLLHNQGVSGTAGFLAGFRRPGRRRRRCVEVFLGAAIAGDEISARRALSSGAAVSLGEDTPIAVGEFVDRVRGGRWFKVIAAGDTVSVSVNTPSGRGVVFCDVDSAARGITRVRYFGAS